MRHARGTRKLRAAGLILLINSALCPGVALAQPAPADPARPGVAASGLPVPRFVSLKTDRVNLRTGPGTEYPATWVFQRAGMPVEVVQEFDTWRQVRDAEGTSGWVLHSLLSGRRTALVLPWEIKSDQPKPQLAIHADDSERSRPVAMVEAGVIANVHSCDRNWCAVSIGIYRGYVQQKKLWGVYEGEVIK